MTGTPAEPDPAYLRWRKDNRIAGTLVTAAVSILASALAVIFGLNIGRGSVVYIAVLLVAAVLSGLIMTHNKIVLTVSKPLILLAAGATIFVYATHSLHGRASLTCCAVGALLAVAYVVIARGPHWTAFWTDVQSGEDTPHAAVRALQKKP